MADENTGSVEPAGADGGATSAPSIAEVMAFDPFSPPTKPEVPAAATAGEGTKTVDDKGTEGSKAGATVTPPAPDPKAAQPDPTKASQGQVAATPPQPQQPQQPTVPDALARELQQIKDLVTPKADAKAAEPSKPRYELAIPPQIIAGLRSEDDGEFAQSMGAIVNGIANKIWNDVNQHLQNEFGPSMVRNFQASQAQTNELKSVNDDFFGAHEGLKNPMLLPLVQQAGIAVVQDWMRQGKSTEWSPELRDAIAESVYTIVPHLKAQPKSNGAPAAQVRPAAPRAPAFATGSGSRPAAETANEFADVLKFN